MKRLRMLRIWSCLAVVLVFATWLPTQAQGGVTTYIVDTPEDSDDLTLDGVCRDAAGHCSLRAALQEFAAAYSPVLVQIDEGVTLIEAVNGEWEISTPTTFTHLTIQGNGVLLTGDEIFRIRMGEGQVAISDIEVAQAQSVFWVDSGRVTLDEVFVHDSAAVLTVQVETTVTITNSQFEHNQTNAPAIVTFKKGGQLNINNVVMSDNRGGDANHLFLNGFTDVNVGYTAFVSYSSLEPTPNNAVYFEGGTIAVTNSTVSSIGIGGAGIELGDLPDSSLSLNWVTLINHTDLKLPDREDIAVSISHTLFGGQTDCRYTGGAIRILGHYNLSQTNQCNFFGEYNQSDIDLNLGDVQMWGDTYGVMPLWGSPAVGYVGVGCALTDQRLVERPSEYCDVGAIENPDEPTDVTLVSFEQEKSETDKSFVIWFAVGVVLLVITGVSSYRKKQRWLQYVNGR